MGSFLLSVLRIKIFGKMGLRDQNKGKKIGINGSRIYHVTTLSYNHTILEGDTLTSLPKQFLWENDSVLKKSKML